VAAAALQVQVQVLPAEMDCDYCYIVPGVQERSCYRSCQLHDDYPRLPGGRMGLVVVAGAQIAADVGIVVALS